MFRVPSISLILALLGLLAVGYPVIAADPPENTSRTRRRLIARSRKKRTDDLMWFNSSGNVQVCIHLENTDGDTLQKLRNLGADIGIANSDWKVVEAWEPIEALNHIAALYDVEEITAPDYAVTKAGNVTTGGDVARRADLVRAFSGIPIFWQTSTAGVSFSASLEARAICSMERCSAINCFVILQD